MKRTLAVGADWNALTAELARGIGFARNSGSRLTIAVPSQAAKHWLLRRLAVLLNNDLSGLNVLTLHQLALEALLRQGTVPEVSEDKRYLFAVWEMLQEDPELFKFPKNDPYPTVRRLYASLRELRDAAVSAEEARWLSEQEPYEHLSRREAERAGKLFSIYARYLGALEKNGWMDSPAMMMSAAAAGPSPRLPLSTSSPLFVWGFYDFTGVQKLFLKSFAKSADSMRFFIPEHEYTLPLIQEIQGWDFSLIPSPPHPITVSPPLILSCPTAKEEAWIIAKLLRLEISQGAHPSDCVVIYRQNAPYFPALEKALLENGIPFVTPEDPAERLSAKPAGAALRAAIAFWESPSGSSAAELLERPACSFHSRFSPYIASLTARIFSLSRPKLNALLGSKTLNTLLEKLAGQEPSIPSSLKIETAAAAAGFLALCREGMEISERPSPAKLSAWLRKTIAAPQAPALRSALARFFEMIESLSPGSLKSRSFTAQILLEALSSIELDSARTVSSASGVWLVTANQARGGAWKHVFLCGVVDGAYPLEMKEDPFLSETARARLNHLGFSGLSRFKNPDKGALEDALLFKLLTASAQDSLTISLPQLDAEAKPLLPSPCLETYEENGRLSPQTMASAAWGERLRLLSSLCSARGAEAGGYLTIEELEWENAAKESGTLWSALAAAEENVWKEWLEKKERLSPTYLSDFLSCPQAFYWKQYQRLPGEPRALQREFFPPIFLGNAFSEALVRSLKEHQTLRGLKEAWRAILAREFPEIETKGLAAAERYKMRRLENLLDALEAQWSKTWPQKIKTVEAEKPLNIPLKERALYARADAVLEGESYFEFKLKRRSIFKSSGTRTKPLGMLENLLNPGNIEGAQYGLQVLFYLLEAQNNSGAGATLLNAFWELETGKTAPPVFYTWNASEDLSPLKEKLSRWVSIYTGGAARVNGLIVFPFWPHEKQGKRCGGCAYQTLCLKDAPAVRAAHQRLAAPLAASFADGEDGENHDGAE